MEHFDFFLRAQQCRTQQLDCGDMHIRSVEDLVAGSFVRLLGTNGEMILDELVEVSSVDLEVATNDPQAKSIRLCWMPSISASGVPWDAWSENYSPCDLGLAAWPNPETARWIGHERVLWTPTALFRHEDLDSII